MINWKVRINNKAFWALFIPALALVIKAVANLFGFVINLDPIVEKLLMVVEAVFALLGVVGVVNDPTTAGIADSARAKTYVEPWKDETA